MEKEKIVALVEEARAGDMRAMESLLRLAHTSVSYQCRKIMAHAEDAEDMTQEVLMKIYRNIRSLKEPEKFIGWANSIAARHCISELRKGPKDHQFLEDEEGHSIQDDLEELDRQKIPDCAVDNDETARMIGELIDALPEAQRLCTYLFYYDELSVKEIAEIAGVSENTVKSRLNYARKAIKEGVEAYEKKQGIKLYGFSPLPFLLYFLRKSAEAGADAAAAEEMAKAAISAGGVAAGGATGAVATAVTEGVAVNAAGSAAGTVAGASGKAAGFFATVAGKVTAGVVAGAVAIGGIAAATNSNDGKPSEDEEDQPRFEEFFEQTDTEEGTLPPDLEEVLLPAYAAKRTTIATGYDNAEIYLETPEFEETSPGYGKINALFEKIHEEFLSGGDAGVAEMQEKIDMMNTGEYSYAYTVTFTVQGQDDRYLSVSLNRCWNVADVISYTFDDYTFDVETGEQLELTDLVDGTEEEIRAMMVDALTAEYGEEVMPVGKFENYKYDAFRFYVKDGRIWVFPNVSRVALSFVPLPVELECGYQIPY